MIAKILIYLQALELFREGLRERGYVEGKNIEIVYRYISGEHRQNA